MICSHVFFTDFYTEVRRRAIVLWGVDYTEVRRRAIVLWGVDVEFSFNCNLLTVVGLHVLTVLTRSEVNVVLQ